MATTMRLLVSYQPPAPTAACGLIIFIFAHINIALQNLVLLGFYLLH